MNGRERTVAYKDKQIINDWNYDLNKSGNKMQLFFRSLLLDVHMWLNMFRASPCPSSGAYNCTRNIRFYLWKETAGA
jgi:hypothetical protein